MRRLSLAGVVAVLAASGAYALIYLFRWEWHRAIITALFFVAAEIGLGLALILRRLARLEQYLDELAKRPSPAAATVDPAVLARIQEAAPPARNPFAWLDPGSPNLSVFLPFLLGIGALASGLAWVVEQVARKTTTPALERRLALRLSPLALPEGGLLGPALAPAPRSRERVSLGRSLFLPLAAVTVVAALAVGGIDWLGDAIQTRPETRREGVSTRIEIELRGSRSVARPEQSAAILWGTCSHVLHGSVGPATISSLGGGRMELVVPTDIGPRAEERVRGCLEDAVVDRVQASVLTLEPLLDP
ncbi:MAG: hypothetical protein ACRDYW_04445 [Acidimicrobiales bacterium]